MTSKIKSNDKKLNFSDLQENKIQIIYDADSQKTYSVIRKDTTLWHNYPYVLLLYISDLYEIELERFYAWEIDYGNFYEEKLIRCEKRNENNKK